MAESLTAPYGGTLLQRQARLYNYNSGERWRFRLWVWEYRLAGEGELAKAGGEKEATLWLVEGKRHTTLPG
jgi:hypothetical protein